ncbi:MAG: mercury methylation ferredoxin HgcB [Candidatus Aminicenantales bacterium]
MSLQHLKNVATLKYDSARCTGCGFCREVCPHGVFEIEGRKARVTDSDLCMECGACARNCAFGAIDVHAGVGCAFAIMWSALRHKSTPQCGE